MFALAQMLSMCCPYPRSPCNVSWRDGLHGLAIFILTLSRKQSRGGWWRGGGQLLENLWKQTEDYPSIILSLHHPQLKEWATLSCARSQNQGEIPIVNHRSEKSSKFMHIKMPVHDTTTKVTNPIANDKKRKIGPLSEIPRHRISGQAYNSMF